MPRKLTLNRIQAADVAPALVIFDIPSWKNLADEPLFHGCPEAVRRENPIVRVNGGIAFFPATDEILDAELRAITQASRPHLPYFFYEPSVISRTQMESGMSPSALVRQKFDMSLNIVRQLLAHGGWKKGRHERIRGFKRKA